MKIGIIGINSISEAIIKGLINSQEYNKAKVYVCNDSTSNVEPNLEQEVNVVHNVEALLNTVQIVILNLKPTLYVKWLNKYENLISKKLIISTSPEINSEFLSKYTSLFVLTFPNIGTLVQKGYTIICINEKVAQNLNEVIIEETAKIFSTVGKVKIIKESELSNYMNMLYSSPIYFIDTLKSMVQNFNQLGYDQTEVQKALTYIMESSVHLLQNEEVYNLSIDSPKEDKSL